MRQNRISITAALWLQLVTSLFLITLGITGLVGAPSSLLRSGAFFRGGGFGAVASVMELAGGGILFVAALGAFRGRFFFWVGVVLFALWLMLILEAFFMRGFLAPTVLAWLSGLSWYGITAVTLWIIARRYR